jgi:tRNA (guanine-N7-)-methyltransferase
MSEKNSESPRLHKSFEQAKQELPEDSEHYLHRIKSFVLRTGRLTAGQARAIETLGPQFLLPFTGQAIDWDKSFQSDGVQVSDSNQTPRLKILEIGFGMGETTAKIAAARPADDFLAIEVHEPGVGALLKLIGEQGLTNLRLMRHDAVEVVENMIPESFLDGVHVYFPDPWHKKRHNKRRIVNSDFLSLIAAKLKDGGHIHIATDWVPYAQWIEEVFAASELFEGGKIERPDWRPVTRFEGQGITKDHLVNDFKYFKK